MKTTGFLVLAAMVSMPVFAGETEFVNAVTASKPIAFYRLASTSGRSETGSTTYKAQGGAVSGPGAFGAGSQAVKLNGRDGYLVTTQAGGVAGAAAIMAWVNLDSLPSAASRIFYIAGESEGGNDLDLQLEADNAFRFFTAGGGNLEFKPAPASLVRQWHMIVATLDVATRARAIYWDGKQVAADKGSGEPTKKAAFTIGESLVFKGRWFNGSIEEVALWNRAISASEVAGIYAAAGSKGAAAPATAATSPGAGRDLFPTAAKVTIVGPNGPLALKAEEKIAFMFASGVQEAESDCQFKLQRACTAPEVMAGAAAPNGPRTLHLKYDPGKDPNYTYSVGAVDMNWDVHATPKKPGLMGFYMFSRGLGTSTIVYNPNGAATAIDRQFNSTSIEGDSFAIQ